MTSKSSTFCTNAAQDLECGLLFGLFDLSLSAGEPFTVKMLPQAGRFDAHFPGDLIGPDTGQIKFGDLSPLGGL